MQVKTLSHFFPFRTPDNGPIFVSLHATRHSRPKSRRFAAACADHERPHAARVGHNGRLEHAALHAASESSAASAAASAAMGPKRESAARSTKPPTSICARRNRVFAQVADREAVFELLPQLRDGLESRTLASESSSGRCRRASAAVRRRRPAAGDPSCCRYSGAPTGRRLERGLRGPLGFQIGGLGAPNLLSPARARYSWSAGLRWAKQSHLLRHHPASPWIGNLPALRFYAVFACFLVNTKPKFTFFMASSKFLPALTKVCRSVFFAPVFFVTFSQK